VNKPGNCRGYEVKSTKKPTSNRHNISTFLKIVCFLLLAFGVSSAGFAQELVPFKVSNPKNKKWSREEAIRVYQSACTLVARSVRPERPPHLHPNFVLVLGADDDEVVRTGPVPEIHLKLWNVNKFAEGVVIMAARDILQTDDLNSIARQSVSSAQATVTLEELKQNR
jgi:hypothetical protein